MSRFTLLVAVAMSLTACGGKKKQSAGSAEAIAKLTEFKARACACKDAVCISGVVVDFQKWSDAFNAGKKADDPMSADDEKQIDALNASTKVCVDKFDLTGSAAAPPAAPKGEPPAAHGGDGHAEAQLLLNRIGKSSKTYFAVNAAFMKGKAAVLPAGNCCAGPDKKCAVAKDAFEKDPVWKELDFQVDEPSSFSYSYESDGATFTATAVGDPDCSGTMETYRATGKSEAGNPSVEITGP